MGACWGRDSTSGGDANNGDQQQQKAQERRTTPAVIHAPPSPQQLQELQPVPSLPLPEAFRSLASRAGADDIPGNPTHATAPPAASCVPPQPHPVVQQELQSLLQLPLPEAFRSLASRAGPDNIPGNPTHAAAPPAASSVPPQPQPVVQQELQALLPLPLPEASRPLASRADPDDIPGKPTHASRVSQQPQPVVQQEPPPVVHRLPLPTVFRSSHPRSEPINILGKQFEDVLSHFTIGKELGRGRFGITYLCHERTTGNQYACKTFPKWKLASKSDQDDVRTEVAIMQDVSGQLNIVEFKGAYEDANSVHLVMEMCDGGELFDRITAKGSYSEREVAGVFRSIAVVVNVCHLLGVMHRDMKPENLLLVGKGKRAKLKLTNFGLSAYIKEGKVFRDVVGSPYYIAPEVLKRRSGKEADVWSAGVILYILLCGAPPFCAKNEKGICDAILKGDIDFEAAPWPYISDSAKDLIKKMLTQDPKERITAAQVLEHPWIREDGTAPDILLDSSVVTSLRQFRAMDKLKKTALKVIAEKLSEEDIKGMKQMFISMDTDSNDTITYDELIIGLGQFKSKFSENEVKQLLEAVHIKGNGSIDYNEFITATMHRHRLEKDDYLHRTFQSFDKDNSGFITRDELELIMKEHGIGGDEAGIKDIVSKVDIENDGRINFAEFRDMMISGMQQQQQQQQPPPPEVGGS